MLWPAVLSLLLAVATWAKEPSLQLHDSSFVPDAVLRVTQQTVSIGCIERESVVINGTVPGPQLSFASGSRVWIRVYNDMPNENLTMHWHGLTMAAAPFADGSPAASQWPIAPMKFFDYELNLAQTGPGSYFYHSHVGFQAMTAAGALLVTDKPEGDAPPYEYDDERVLMFTDLYNTTDHDIESGLSGRPFKWSGEVGGVLINGRGLSEYRGAPTLNEEESSSSSSSSSTEEEDDDSSCSLDTISVEPGKTYRVRMIGATALSFFTLGVEAHNLTIVEADGAYTEPVEVPFVQVGGGQRYSALLKTFTCDELAASGGGSQFYVQLETRDRPKSLTTYAVLDYGSSCDAEVAARAAAGGGGGGKGGSGGGSGGGSRTGHFSPISTTTPPDDAPLDLPDTVQGWLDDELRPLKPRADFPTADEVTRTVVLDIYQLAVGGDDSAHQGVEWAQNGLSWYESTPRVPYLVALYTNATAALPDYDAAVASGTGRDARPGVEAFPARLGEVLEIVIQNTGSYSGGVDVHPMHLHGAHYFYLGSGEGTYDRAANEARLAGRTPVTRDTTMLYRYGEKEEPKRDHSWVAWRIRVEQPGVWMLHCHTLQHMIMGMQTVWVFGNSSDILTLPLPMVQGYLAYGGDVYGDDENPPSVVHFYDTE